MADLLSGIRDRRQQRGLSTPFLDEFLAEGGLGSGYLMDLLRERSGSDRPVLDALGRNSNALLLAGAGMRQGEGGFGAGWAQGAQLDAEAAEQQRQREEADQQRQAILGAINGAPAPFQALAEAGVYAPGVDWLTQQYAPAAPGYGDIVTGEQAAAIGLDPALTWQRSPEGRWQQVGGGGQNITVNTGGTQSPFGEQLAEGMAGAFLDQRSAALDALDSLDTITQARQLLDQGTLVGPGVDFFTWFGNALERIGIDLGDGDARANTQAFGAIMAAEVGRIISLFGAGTGLSDADRDFARQAAGGDLTMDEDALRRILDINERVNRNLISAYNEQAAAIEGQPGYTDAPVVPFPLQLDVPPQPQRPPDMPPEVTGAVNPETGEALWLNPETGQWEPWVSMPQPWLPGGLGVPPLPGVTFGWPGG